MYVTLVIKTKDFRGAERKTNEEINISHINVRTLAYINCYLPIAKNFNLEVLPFSYIIVVCL